MKTLLTLALIAATVAAGTVQADQSDRYRDLRLDTSVTQFDFNRDTSAQVNRPEIVQNQRRSRITFATKNRRETVPYAYRNAYGVGPHNDSR